MHASDLISDSSFYRIPSSTFLPRHDLPYFSFLTLLNSSGESAITPPQSPSTPYQAISRPSTEVSDIYVDSLLAPKTTLNQSIRLDVVDPQGWTNS